MSNPVYQNVWYLDIYTVFATTSRIGQHSLDFTFAHSE